MAVKRLVAFVILILALVIAPSSLLRAQELSDVVYPSEDEIREGLQSGEISWEQYLILLELIQHGIDSTNSHLLDQIPNLSFFRELTRTSTTVEEDRQGRSFRKTDRPDVRGQVRYRYYRRLEEEGKYTNSYSAQLKVRDHWSGAFRINRDISGRQQLQSRHIKYSRSDGVVRRILVGSFNMRLGLGAVVGYHGRLLQFSNELRAESFLFPDYGGHNGLGAELRFGDWTVSGVGSVKRDSCHRLLLGGLAVERKLGRSSVGFIAGLTMLKNRLSGQEYYDRKFSVHTKYVYSGGYSEIELVGQDSDVGNAAAVVMEGRHRYHATDIRYSGWTYADRFVDLTSGSKASRLGRTFELVESEFVFRSRRTGQSGGLVRIIMPISDQLRINSSVLAASVNADNSLVQMSSGISRKFGEHLHLQVDVLENRRRLLTPSGETGPDWRRGRFEARFRTGSFDLRAYIAHTSREKSSDYWSILCDVEIDTEMLGRFSIWTNLSRLNRAGVQYSYMFVSNKVELLDAVDLTTKLAHRYSKSVTERHQMAVSLELTARL